jgi:hypothetical protein
MPSQNEVTSSNKISRGDDIIFDRSVWKWRSTIVSLKLQA